MRTHLLDPDDLPLTIGGPDDALGLPGVSSERALAHVGADDGALFIQPADDAPQPVLCNGVVVTASRWLHDGDLLGLGAARVEVVGDGDHTLLRVSATAGAVPGARTDPAAAPAATTVHGAATTVAPSQYVPRSLRPARRPGFRLRPLVVLGWVVVVVVAGLLWYVLTARSVMVEVVPEPERLAVRGGLAAPRLGGRFLLRPGEYTVVAERSGYRALEEQIRVGSEPRQSFRLTLEILPGLLSVSTGAVTGAEVLVDGVRVGVTPLDGLELAPGTHHVLVRAPRHRELLTTAEIEGAGATRHLELELEPAFAPVTVRSEPVGATVVIDGDRRGTTPLTTDLGAGAHELELVLSGYRPHRGRLLVAAGEAQTPAPIRLRPWEGNLVVLSEPAGASVVVDGVFRGTTPVDVRLAPGRDHELKLSLAGHEGWTRQVRLGSGERSQIDATLAPLLGRIEIDCRPSDAELVVDGVSRGRAGQSVELEAVPHHIEVRKQGFAPYEITLTPQIGFTQRLDVVLQPLGAAVRAAPEVVIRTSQEVEMRLVPPGRFTMGASRREPGRRANETLRQVELTRAFYLAVREVTNREFRQFQEGHLSGRAGSNNLEIDHHPVVRVSWQDAARYCNWLSARESLPEVYEVRGPTVVARSPLGAGYRLPTEAEWAWAARYDASGSVRKYPWGNALPVPAGAGNYGDRSARLLLGSGLPDYDDGYPATAPAGSFGASPRGIYNIAGNVAEWVHDVYTIHLGTPGLLERDPTGPAEGEYHVIRGASWMDDSVTELRLSYRDYGSEARPDVGFRVARTAE